MTNRTSCRCAALCAVLLASSSIAAEREAPPDPNAQIQEVVVTSQRRAENLQDVPISVQVVGNEQLATHNYSTLEQLTQTTPAVHISSDQHTNNLFIRGVGSGSNSSFDQSVATFTDDIYKGRSRLTTATFLDVDRIEILKGPQSTFFGNNAIAGALNIVSRKPGNSFEADSRLLYGMYGEYTAQGAVTLPVLNTLSVRAALGFDGESGWIKNVETGEHAPRLDNKAARVTFAYEPIDALDATLKIEATRNHTGGTPYGLPNQIANCPPPAPLPPSAVLNGSCPNALARGVPIGLDNNENTGLPGQYNSLATHDDVLSLNYHLGQHTITSVSGFTGYHSDEHADTGNLISFPVGNTRFLEHYHQFSQELRLTSPTDQVFEYMAGAYYQSDELRWQQVNNVPILNPYVGFFPALAPLLPYMATSYDQATAYDERYTLDETTYSAFGSVGWNATDRLKVDAGLRASWVKKHMDWSNAYGTTSGPFGAGFVPMPADVQPLAAALYTTAPGTLGLGRDDHAWMPSAGVQFKLTPDAMAYFKYARGFKAGGLNGELVFGPTTHVAFDPEHVNSYELGIKSKWLADRLLVNAAVFQSNYSNLQVEAFTANASTNTFQQEVRNAATSRSRGVELETQWVVDRSLRLTADVSYLKSIFVSYPNAAAGPLQGFCGQSYVLPYCAQFPFPVPALANLSGHPTPYSPLWSGSVAAIYSVAVAGGYKVTADLSPYFSSSYNDDEAPYEIGTAGYVRLDARLSFGAADERWNIDVIGRNLTDRVIYASLANNIGINQKEAPRTAAVQLRYHW